MNSPPPLRIGTRASPLARWQADWVAARLAELAVDAELVLISTRGDRDQTDSIRAIAGGDGIFTKELQRALLNHEIDVAVHSLKDLPTQPVGGLVLAGVPVRGPSGDVLVTPDHRPLEQLARGAVIGTGSLRRRAQLLHVRPDLQMGEIRGNVDTRLRKLDSGQYGALVLAEAGLERLGLAGCISQVLPKHVMLPAVGQGALGLEARVDDERTAAALGQLNDPATQAAVLAERSMLATVGGGCLAPVGAWARVQGGRLHLDAVVLSPDGSRRLFATGAADLLAAEDLGRRLAEELLAQGAAELIDASRNPG
jgi:hydroxymethylbilane synthase